MNVKALIVHLNRATDRRQQVERIAGACPVPAEVVEAVDGATLDEDTIRSVYVGPLRRPHYPFTLRTAEIACFLSHRKCWQTAIEQNLDAVLIVEDDIEFDKEVFYPAFELAVRNIRSDDIIRFPIKRRESAISIRAATPKNKLYVPKVPGLGTGAQLVGQAAVRSLLDTTRKFDRPIDVLLQMWWVTGVRPLSVFPAGISEESAQLGGSQIGKQKSWAEILRRELLRPLYRRRLAALASAIDRRSRRRAS